MSTTALICVQRPRFDIYYGCLLQNDGDPTRAGRTLLRNYKKFYPIYELTQLYELSELGPSADTSIAYPQAHPVEPLMFRTTDKMFKYAQRNYIRYIYLFRLQHWLCCKVNLGNYFIPLEEVVHSTYSLSY